MPYTAKITEVRKEFSLPDNESYLDVHFDLLLDGKVIQSLKKAFPLETEEAVILDDLSRYCKVFEEDTIRAEEVQKRSEAEKAADEKISNLTGKEV
jgi:hypothetical protein